MKMLSEIRMSQWTQNELERVHVIDWPCRTALEEMLEILILLQYLEHSLKKRNKKKIFHPLILGYLYMSSKDLKNIAMQFKLEMKTFDQVQHLL